MPDPKTCAAKGLVPGTKEYQDCIDYKGSFAPKGKPKGSKPANPVKGSLRKPAGKGGY